jgi:hypothetical protein
VSMDFKSGSYKIEGEVIKLIYGEMPAVRWTCGNCEEDSCTIFEPGADEKLVECETCSASNLVRMEPAE